MYRRGRANTVVVIIWDHGPPFEVTSFVVLRSWEKLRTLAVLLYAVEWRAMASLMVVLSEANCRVCQHQLDLPEVIAFPSCPQIK